MLDLRTELDNWGRTPMKKIRNGTAFQILKPMPPSGVTAFCFGVKSRNAPLGISEAKTQSKLTSSDDGISILSKEEAQRCVRGSPAGLLSNVIDVTNPSVTPMPRSADGTQGFDRKLETPHMPYHQDLTDTTDVTENPTEPEESGENTPSAMGALNLLKSLAGNKGVLSDARSSDPPSSGKGGAPLIRPSKFKAGAKMVLFSTRMERAATLTVRKPFTKSGLMKRDETVRPRSKTCQSLQSTATVAANITPDQQQQQQQDQKPQHEHKGHSGHAVDDSVAYASSAGRPKCVRKVGS